MSVQGLKLLTCNGCTAKTVHCGNGGLTVATRVHYDYEDDEARAMEERRQMRRRRRVTHKQIRLLLQLRREVDNLNATRTAGGQR